MLKMSGKMMWMKEVMKPLNMLKSVPVRPRGAVLLDKTGAWGVKGRGERNCIG